MYNPILYIIGNGFDLAHGMKTSYEHFHQWLIDNGEYSTILRLESLYPNIKNTEGRWCDIESALGSITLEEAINYDKNFQECPDEINNENSSFDAYRCGENIRNTVDIFPGLLMYWINSISTKKVNPQFDIDKNAYFLSFNYTRTLEDVYQVRKENVLHIHETSMDNKQLIVGYGEALFENEDYVLDNEQVDVALIKNLLSHCRKPVDAILKEPMSKAWFSNLVNVSSIIVFGHSCSKVDKPYFETIAKSVKADAHWTFYVYDPTQNASFERFAKSIKKDSQKIEIIN